MTKQQTENWIEAIRIIKRAGLSYGYLSGKNQPKWFPCYLNGDYAKSSVW